MKGQESKEAYVFNAVHEIYHIQGLIDDLRGQLVDMAKNNSHLKNKVNAYASRLIHIGNLIPFLLNRIDEPFQNSS